MDRTHYLEKLQAARELLASPEANQSSLHMALIKAHSTLEDYLREALDRANRRRGVTSALVGDMTVQWRELASLAEQQGLLTPRQRQTALDTNRMRVRIAHGEDVAVARTEVEAYCGFVEAIVERGQAQKPRAAAPEQPPPAPAQATPSRAAPSPGVAAPPRQASAARQNSATRQAAAPAPRASRQAPIGRTQPPAGVMLIATIVLLTLLVLFAISFLSSRPAPLPEHEIVTPGPLPTLMQGG